MMEHHIPAAKLSEASASHQNFMQVVYQVNNIACLFGQNDDGSLSAEYVTPSFVTLMECEAQEEALALMDGDRLFASTWPEDRPILRDILGFIEENQEMVRVLLSPHGDMNFLHRLNDVLREKCLQFVRRVAPNEGEASFDYQYSFVIFGTAGLIRAWVNRNCAESTAEIAQMAGRMIRTGSLA